MWLWNRENTFQSDFGISDDILLSVNKQSGLLNREGVLGSSAGKESASSAGEPSLIPGLGRSPEGGHGNPLQYSCLENSMDRGAWQAIQSMGSKRVRHTEVTQYTHIWKTVLRFLKNNSNEETVKSVKHRTGKDPICILEKS